MNNNQSQDSSQYFAALKAYYQVEPYSDSSLDDVLYFILRKIDMTISLTEFEIAWLKSNGFTQVTKYINGKPKQINGLVTEIMDLLKQYVPLRYQAYHFGMNLTLPSQPIGFILKKIASSQALTDNEINYLNGNGFAIVVNAAVQALKIKYKATQHGDTQPSSQLYQVLKQLDIKAELTLAQIEWLQTQKLPETWAIFEQQESAKNNQFAALKAKYQANSYMDTSYMSRPLYEILQLLESNKPITAEQETWLKIHGLSETLVVVNNMGFNRLKEKYKVTAIQETSISSHLYKVLKRIEAKEILGEQDFNFLKKRNLIPTLAIYLQQKIELNMVLIETEYHWLEQNRQHDEITASKVILHYLISKKLDAGQRLDELEATWLDDKFKSDLVWTRHHEIEAKFYENEYKRTGNKWNLPNASSHWRKASKPELALAVTHGLNFEKIKEDKLKSALLTTRGGAFRDLSKLDEAEHCAKQAIECYPKSHHPYTLMGAICFERGQYNAGETWFAKAIERGASPRDQDAEIKAIIRKTKEPNKLLGLVKYLLGKDSDSYAWINAELKQVIKNNKDLQRFEELFRYLLTKDSKRYVWAKEYLKES